MQLIGLVHDVGKMMFKYGTPADGHEGTATGCQWALGGDTWVVGCKLPDGACFPEFNELNPDMKNPEFNASSAKTALMNHFFVVVLPLSGSLLLSERLLVMLDTDGDLQGGSGYGDVELRVWSR